MAGSRPVRWALAAGLVVAVAVATLLASLLVIRLDARDQRRRDTYGVINKTCDAVNVLPQKIAAVLAKSQRIQQITGPTTTVPRTNLTPTEQAEVDRLSAEVRDEFADLGRPVDCYRR